MCCAFALLGVEKWGEKGMNQPRLSAALRLLPAFPGVCCVVRGILLCEPK